MPTPKLTGEQLLARAIELLDEDVRMLERVSQDGPWNYHTTLGYRHVITNSTTGGPVADLGPCGSAGQPAQLQGQREGMHIARFASPDRVRRRLSAQWDLCRQYMLALNIAAGYQEIGFEEGGRLALECAVQAIVTEHEEE